MSFAKAQQQYDRQEPPAGNEAICGNCGERQEDHERLTLDMGGAPLDHFTVCRESIQDILDGIKDNTFTEDEGESEDDYRLRQAGL